MENGFMECAECAAKPGLPVLCKSCLNNRDLIIRLAAERMVRNPTFAEWSNGIDEALSQDEFNAADADARGEYLKNLAAMPKGNFNVLPNGMHLKAANPATQAKYFYHHEVELDGQKVTETIGFQTHAEMLMHMIQSAISDERKKELVAVWNSMIAGTCRSDDELECGEWPVAVDATATEKYDPLTMLCANGNDDFLVRDKDGNAIGTKYNGGGQVTITGGSGGYQENKVDNPTIREARG